MKNLSIFAIIIAALSSCQNLNFAKKDLTSPVISKYKGGVVTAKDVDGEIEKLIAKNPNLKGLTFSQLKTEEKEALIKEIVLNEFIYTESKKRKLDRDQDYKDALKILETEILKQKLFVNLAQEVSKEENLKKNYDEITEKLKNKKDVRISYIALKTENEAKSVYQILSKNPNYFTSFAKKKSIDKEIAAKGGDLGFVIEDALPSEILKQVRVTGKGKISQPILNNGKWVIAKMDDEKPSEILPFDKAKESLAKNLAKKAIEDFLKKSLDEAKIVIELK